MTDRKSWLVALSVLVAAVAVAGCDVLEEKIREQSKPSAGSGGGAPAPVPPPASPPVVDGPACASTASCPAGLRCSTERGDCNRPPGCGRADVCPAVCYGVCESPKPSLPSNCSVDSDCRLFSDYCTGCDCRALAKGEMNPVCTGPGVRCFADPCLNQQAVCAQGRCALKGARPVPPKEPPPTTPPPPPRRCTGEGEGSETTCLSTGEWKDRAYLACRKQGLELTNYWPGGECGPDRYRHAKWECCGPVVSPPPPPPPTRRCTGDGEGSETTCRSSGEWKERAYLACRNQGLDLVNYWPAGDCGPDRYRYSKWECCGPPVMTPPPPVTPPPPGGNMCFGGSDGSETSCKSPELWKKYASELCAQKGAQLQDVGYANDCGGGAFRYVRFSCCAPTPPDPPPPPQQKCSADAECPKIRAACQMCPDRMSSSCPSSQCLMGICQVIWPACPGVPTPTPPDMPWNPCGGKMCGEPCTFCPPWSKTCVEDAALKTCNLDGKCDVERPSCTRR